MKETTITLGVVDDHPLMRKGLISLIEEIGGIDVVLEASDGNDMQARLMKGAVPDVILMDLRMRGMDGFAAALWLKEHFPHIKVLALSMIDDEDAIVTMLKNGACGYVLKESRPTEIVYAIRTVMERGFYLNDLVSGKLIHSLQHPCADSLNPCGITEKEQIFINLCCTELTYKEIAAKMGLSPNTVENYREAVFRKLDVKSRSGIILYAVRNKMVKI